MIILILFAFLAGIVTVLSPCILPILPIILTSTIGDTYIGKSRPLGVVCGFILSFTFFTLFLSTIVRLSGISADSVRIVSIIVIAGFGASLLVPAFQIFVEQMFSRLSGFLPHTQGRKGFGGGLIIGLSIGLLWTPCVGPILASVISLAITGTVTFDAFLITLAYSLGTSIPMFLIMLGGQHALRRVPWLLSRLGYIQKIFGVLMILTAIGIFFNIDRKFQTYILNTFPQYGIGLTSFEDTDLIKKTLENVSDGKKEETEGHRDPIDPQKTTAPEIIPGGVWFNLPDGENPPTLEQLRGKVVIIDFWTYSCINCQRTLPYLKRWYETYKEKGLVIIGVHSPEFEFEKSEKNVGQAIKDFGITYPVVQDNDFSTWRAYNNRYWPAKYVIDTDGYIRYQHFGEGAYDETEQMIQSLLKETGISNISSPIQNPTYTVQSKTPEIYLGYERIEGFSSPERIQKDRRATYTAPKVLGNSRIAYHGEWLVTKEYAQPKKGSSLYLNFDSKDVFLVMRSVKGISSVKARIDETVIHENITIQKETLYTIVRLPSPGRHLLQLEFLDDDAQLFAFTFG